MYRIEIWQYHNKVDEYESEIAEEVVNWYKEEWKFQYDYGMCAYILYADNKRLDASEGFAFLKDAD